MRQRPSSTHVARQSERVNQLMLARIWERGIRSGAVVFVVAVGAARDRVAAVRRVAVARYCIFAESLKMFWWWF